MSVLLITDIYTGGTAQVEKVSHATALSLLASFGEVTQVGVSLGSFSLSGPILVALLDEVRYESYTYRGCARQT